MRKPLVRWALVALVLLLVAAGAMRALSARQERSSAELATSKVEAVVELLVEHRGRPRVVPEGTNRAPLVSGELGCRPGLPPLSRRLAPGP